MKKLTKAKKQKIKKIAIFAGLLFILTAVSCIVIKAVTNDNDIKKEVIAEKFDFSLYKVRRPDIKKMLLTKNVNSRPGLELKSINGIVIHYTANPGTDAEANRNYFEGRKNEPDKSKNKVSSHYIIGLDGTIIQCIPLDEMAYASNDRNSDTISIECCHPDADGKFTARTYNSLVNLTGWLCFKFKLEKSSIIRHYDVTGKPCPLYYVENEEEWEALKDDVWQYLLSCKIEE